MQGIALAALPSSYVSGLSLYFIASQALPRVIPLFSLKRLAALGRGLTPLSLSSSVTGPVASGPDPEEEARMAAMASGMMGPMPGMMPGQGAPGGAGWMAKQAFKGEASVLQVTSFSSALVEGEKVLIGAGQKLLQARLAAARKDTGSKGGKQT